MSMTNFYCSDCRFKDIALEATAHKFIFSLKHLTLVQKRMAFYKNSTDSLF